MLARLRSPAGGDGRAWRPLFAVLVVSALLTALSESFYWYSGGTDYPARVLFYVIPTTALLWVLAAFPGASWPTVVLAGAVYGFITEGVLTAVVYGGFPFDPFAISYTSLAWHALVTVGFGLVLLHRLLARWSIAPALAVISLFGAFWGVWAMSLRLPPEPDDELPSLGALVGQVGVGTFALYTVAATVAVGVCHFLLGHVVRPSDLVPGRRFGLLVLGVGGLWFAILIVPAAPWAPVELSALIWVSCWGMAQLSDSTGATGGRHPREGVTALVCEPIPVARLGLLATLPVTAIATYGLLVYASPGEETIRTFCLEVVVAIQTVVGWAFFAAALWVAFRSRARAREA